MELLIGAELAGTGGAMAGGAIPPVAGLAFVCCLPLDTGTLLLDDDAVMAANIEGDLGPTGLVTESL